MLGRPAKVVFVVAVGSAVAGAVAVGADPRLRHLVRRWASIGAVSARSAARWLVHTVRRRSLPIEDRAALDVAISVRTAQDVAATLGEMKGAFMKVGQLFSVVGDSLPEEARAALAQLQDSVTPMAPELAAGVIRAELGADPTEVFARWDPVPVAAASIGQVHRAALPDGSVVAVKVQYPDVAELIEADLAHLDLGRLFMPAMWPRLDATAVTGELRDRVTEELDYRIEAANQRDFADWYRDHPFIRIPEVIDELSTRRVLTTAFAPGERFAVWEQRPQADRDWAAEAIFRFVFRSIHNHLAFNGDPHPGNYLFEPGAAVTFLDFGMVKRLTSPARDGFTRLVAASALDPDPVELRQVSEELGYFAKGNPLSDEVIASFSAALWSHLASDQPTTITPERATATVKTYFVKGPEYRDVDRWGGLPTDAIILQRITVGLLAVLGRLHATANWHRIARELLLSEAPCTPMGEQEATWLAVQHQST